MSSSSQLEILLPELRAYARSLTRGSDDAEDLVQDAIERALRSDTQPSQLDALRPWMFRVIRNLHYDELRKLRVRREYSRGLGRLSQEAMHVADHAKDVLIRQAYEKLPAEVREILFLVDVMGMKYVETAEILDVPKGTVMSRISRARRALLELIDGVSEGQEDKRR